MFLRGETADQVEKRIAGSWNRKSRVLEGETAGECENRIVGSRWVKTAEKTRAQSPKSNFCNVGDPWSENKKKINTSRFIVIVLFLQ